MRGFYIHWDDYLAGINTVSITWVIPLLEITSAVSTIADPLIISLPFTRVKVSFFPSTVVRVSPSVRSSEVNLPATTWYVRISVRVFLFSGFRRFSTVPAGSFANASLVGPNTVNGHADFRVATSPAALTAVTRVVTLLARAALSTISWDLTIICPPTITPSSFFIIEELLESVVVVVLDVLVTTGVFVRTVVLVWLLSVVLFVQLAKNNTDARNTTGTSIFCFFIKKKLMDRRAT